MTYSCPSCHIVYPTRKDHDKSNLCQSFPTFDCKKCGSGFSFNYLLVSHQKGCGK